MHPKMVENLFRELAEAKNKKSEKNKISHSISVIAQLGLPKVILTGYK